jgi:pimeloyl-ACP methyl ester carboxylesterase
MNIERIESERGFVLLPGGGMGSWIWERMVPLLNHSVLAVDNRYDTAIENLNSVTLENCVDHVIAEIEKTGLKEFVLVAHSGSGIIAPLAAAELTDRIKYLVFISANIPPIGKRSIDVFPFFVKLLNYISFLMMSAGIKQSPKSKEKTIRRYFCNNSEEDVIELCLRHPIKDEPKALAFSRIFRPENEGIPRAFVRLSRDKCGSLEFQDKMIENLGRAEVFTIEGDHMVMLSSPGKLAEVLNGIAGEAFKD